MKTVKALLTAIIVLAAMPASGDMFNSYLEDVSTRVDGGGARSADGDRRGYLTGGNVRVRFQGSKFRNQEIYRIQEPSWDIGCGGVDLNLGSFSHISADAFVEMMKSMIGPEVVAYAFGLALNQFCEACASEMNKIVSEINKFNRMFKSSCEDRGEMLFNATNSAGQYAINKWKQIGVTDPNSSDDIAASDQNRSTPEEAYANAPEKEKGNLVVNAIKDKNLQELLPLPLTTEELTNILISFTGTFIYGPGEADPQDDSSTGGLPGAERVYPSLNSLLPLLTGEGTINGRKCKSLGDGCLELENDAVIVSIDEGDRLVDIIESRLTEGTPDSIIDKFMYHVDGADLNPEDRKIVELLDRIAPFNYTLYRLATTGNSLPQTFSAAAAQIISIDLALEFVKDLDKLAKLIAKDNEHSEVLIEQSDKSYEKIRSELWEYRSSVAKNLDNALSVILQATMRQRSE